MSLPPYYVPGPVTLKYGSGAGLDLGTTKSGVIIQIEEALVPITDDAHGTEPADMIVAGYTALVRAILLDVSKLKLALPFAISPFSSNLDYIGKTSFSGDESGDNLGLTLTITEVGGEIWAAKYAVPTDPEELNLRSTQEFQANIAFRITPDEDDKLFYTLPSYLSP
jgi:hypothetical protein